MAPAAQLALDEAILLEADGETGGAEWLRLWRFDRPVVVIGRSSRIAWEVDLASCDQLGVPVLRRCSGGAAVVGGPGCLMYSVVLSLDRRPHLRKIDAAHQHVMDRLVEAVGRQQPSIRYQGTCDLTWNDRKFSGNSMRVSKRHLLYHGTILHDADLELIAGCLAEAPRQPEYRQGRSHRDFITNLPVDPDRLAADLRRAFGVQGFVDGPGPALQRRMERLQAERYRLPEWHHRH